MIPEWETRLKDLAKSCDYGTLNSELVRDRFIVGLQDENLQRKLLREEKLTLEKAVDTAKTWEATKLQLKQITNENNADEQVSFVTRKHYKNRFGKENKPQMHESKQRFQAPRMSNAEGKCAWCGQQPFHKNGRSGCPAQGKNCSKCGKLNHFAKVCLSNATVPKPIRTEVTEPKSVYEVVSYESDDSIYHIDHEVHTVKAKQGKSKGEKYFANLDIASQGKCFTKIKCQIDTAATVNVMPISHLETLANIDNIVQPSLCRLKMYDNSTLIPEGQCTLSCKRNGRMYLLDFQITEASNKYPLISGSDCVRLKLVDIKADEILHMVYDTQPTRKLTEEIIRHEYSDVFKGLGCIGNDYKIEVDDVKQVIATARRWPISKVDAIKEKLFEMEDAKIKKKRVEKATPWVSNMVAVERKDKLRICIDPVHTFNTAIKRQHYQLPTLEEQLPKLANAKVFSLVDALNGFTQIPLDEESSYLTTMQTPIGRVRWLRLPYGITSAPEEYQRRHSEVIKGLDGVANIADDTLVYGCGETIEEAEKDHDRKLIALLERCRQRNLKLNIKKLKFKQAEVQFMGHLLTREGTKPDKTKVDGIVSMPEPKDKKSVQRYLGMLNYLNKFCKNLSEHCKPLRDYVHDKENWSEAQSNAFLKSKELLTSAPTLRYYDVNSPCTVQVDASDYGLGACIMQGGQPIAYSSRSLTDCEKRYAQVEKECLAICFGMSRFDQYVYGKSDITVETDHKPLESIFKKPLSRAPKRIQKMIMRLQRYNFSVIYKRGQLMYLADTLSREPQQTKCDKTDFEVFATEVQNMDIKSPKISPATLKELQDGTKADKVLNSLSQVIINGSPDNRNKVQSNLSQFFTFRDELTVNDGVVFKGLHRSHQGVESCLRRARDYLFWHGMSAGIKDTCANCSMCASFSVQLAKQPMMSHEIPLLPWQYVSQDLFTLNREDYLITVDHYSDSIEVDKLHDTTASSVVEMSKCQFSRHGIPKTVVTDNGPQFVSSEYELL